MEENRAIIKTNKVAGENMSRKRKQKKQRFLLIVTSVFILLLVLMVKSISGNSKQDLDSSQSSQDDINEQKEQSQSTNNNEISEIKVSPNICTTNTGAVINLNNFKVEAINKSGKKEELNNNILFSTDSDLLEIVNNTITVSDKALTADTATVTVNYKEYNSDITIKIFNDLASTIDENKVVTNPDSYDMVVNKSRNIPSSYIPDDLVPLDDIPKSLQNPEVNQLRKVAYDALKELFAAAKEEQSFDLYARSGYRSYNTQVSLYSSYVSNHGQEAADKFSARPGQSEHQTGLAMDITCPTMNYQLDTTFGDKEEGKWIAENAHKFGFIVRYPKGKEEITGYQYEPWHLRYVGPSLAEEIYKSQLTLEEYFEQFEQFEQ
ncbi:LAS superfamily LD-carboxypeptidase LdcB/predicted nucleic acid-binding Zn ribbon protein [Sedimentibacter acidaminivorans]|uniref:LAS superfamily LD-carboxypeptidase LdcB/predicted nucleic acid-binding Zn ribbon protein n=1 Tax=Sedimentibacter acidaminivorans TaxID=913099 RepID=A0ABS4G8Z4_9FIRM|nr:LAS superfamily LD-carboxypeptidase LdcB/predicted nucleic acid-binding Zn ribbon protein [Sedimentibacter acidaminivorans]